MHDLYTPHELHNIAWGETFWCFWTCCNAGNAAQILSIELSATSIAWQLHHVERAGPVLCHEALNDAPTTIDVIVIPWAPTRMHDLYKPHQLHNVAWCETLL